MPGTRKGAGRGARSQGVKSAEAQVKRLQKQTRELLAKAGKNLREVRHEVAELKRAGLVSSKIDVRKYQPTRYMLRKLKANEDILTGKAVAVKASKSVRQKYVEKGVYEQRGSRLIVPREYAEQRTRISRGLVEVSRPLRNGEEVRLILPFKATDMESLAVKMSADPSLDGMKKPDELFGFRLFGHNMATIGFPTAQEMSEYILTRYAHLFSGKNGREGVKHFELLRFKSGSSQLSEPQEGSAIYTPRKRRERNERDWVANKRRERDALRKRKQRERETDEQRRERLDEQKLRMRRLRERRFLDE